MSPTPLTTSPSSPGIHMGGVTTSPPPSHRHKIPISPPQKCTTCKHPTSVGYRRCFDCRDKSRIYLRARKERLQNAQASAVKPLLKDSSFVNQQHPQIATPLSAPKLFKPPKEIKTVDFSPNVPFLPPPRMVGGAVKRKANIAYVTSDKPSSVVEPLKKKAKVMKENPANLQRIKSSDALPYGSSYVCKRGHKYTEFQTATEMYKHMQSLFGNPASLSPSSSTRKAPMTFRGCYSIVANADVDEETRARLVTDEVHTIAKISFHYKRPTYDCGSTLNYRCTCLATRSSSPPANSSSSSPSSANALVPTSTTALAVSSTEAPSRKSNMGLAHSPHFAGPAVTTSVGSGQSTTTEHAQSSSRHASVVASPHPQLQARQSSQAGQHQPRLALPAPPAAVIESTSSSSGATAQGMQPAGTKLNEICTGTVVICVEKDMSHPVGIPGQRVLIEVWHPSGETS